ncbi:FHA domain-containing protein [Streptomyces sodiiphilus]|uniref:FHA domain-containing protein n=1 Tax=Streptomyces sodiiphilus TaxID=226217 RepID=UPI0031D8EEAE
MQTRLTVLGPLGGHPTGSGSGTDVAVTAPEGTSLADVLGALATAAAPGSGVPGAVYCEGRRLDPRSTPLGHPPLVDGAVISLHRPADAPSRVTPPAARLMVVSGPDAGGVHLLHGGEIRVGRSAGADVPLDDPDVSRLHCVVNLAPDGSLTVADLGSTNGTTLDGVPVTADPVPLRPGALLRVGESALRIVTGDGPPEPVTDHAPALPGPEQTAAGRPARRWGRRRAGATASARPERTPLPEPPPGDWPDPAGVLLTAVESGPRLWENDPSGRPPFTVQVGTVPRAAGPLYPITVDLTAAGSLGLAGPGERLTGLARWVLAQLAVLHPPAVLEIVAVTPGLAREWSWLGWLPHLRPLRGQDCRLLLAFDRRQAAARLRELTERLAAPPERAPGGAGPSRRTVVLLDGDPGGSEQHEAVARLAAHGPQAGVHLLCLARTPPATPASPLADTLAAARRETPAVAACGTVGLLSGAMATTVRLVGPDGEPGAAATADAVSPAWAERFARSLAPHGQPAGAAPGAPSVLPDSCRLLDALSLSRVTPVALRERWARRSGLPLVLGTGPQGPVTVDPARSPGPVLVEGPPGSGRTELLCSMAVSLAAAASPADLALLLVEGSKDGLRPGAELPHTACHLDARDPVRMRAFAQSLRAELKRRAAVLGDREFTEHAVSGGVRRVVAPRPAGRSGEPPESTEPPMRTPVCGPLPRLVVLADDVEALLDPPLGAPGRQAAGSVIRALRAVAEEGNRLGVHLITTAEPGGRPAGLRIRLTGRPPGRAELLGKDGSLPVFQAGRVTGRIPRTATLRPTVVPLDWTRAGDPPARRPVRELGNGPTDVALLASAATRAAQPDQATAASLV